MEEIKANKVSNKIVSNVYMVKRKEKCKLCTKCNELIHNIYTAYEDNIKELFDTRNEKIEKIKIEKNKCKFECEKIDDSLFESCDSCDTLDKIFKKDTSSL